MLRDSNGNKGDEVDSSVDPNAVIQKLAVKLANAEVRNSMLEVALESAREEITRLLNPSEEPS
jgi:hypothetical protein